VCGVHRRQRPGGACRWRVGSSGCKSWKGGIGRTSGGEAASARLGEGSRAPRLAGPATEHHDLEVAVWLKGPATVRSETAGERVRAIGSPCSLDLISHGTVSLIINQFQPAY
jgi:hypothetical protein